MVEVPDQVELVARGQVLVEVGGRRARPGTGDDRRLRQDRTGVADVVGHPAPVVVIADPGDEQCRHLEARQTDGDVQRRAADRLRALTLRRDHDVDERLADDDER
jgi:hypothetical protein